ncbi:MAG TPA: helix-turn-helix transcriptional regulator [Streptosporangiaceae bacterium]
MLGHAPGALRARHCMARCGEPRRALPGARAAAPDVDGPLAELLTGHVEALAARDHARLAEVAAGLGGLGAAPLAAEALGEAARLARASGDQLLAAGLAERLHQVLARCEPRCLPATALPGVVAAPLTSREREIALLSAGGGSDRDIAARLSISPRTVQTHLSRAYAKAGVSSREQLAGVFGLRG